MMAELKKVESYPYEMPTIEDQPMAEPAIQTKHAYKNKTTEIPLSPRKNLKRISRVEKFIGFCMLATMVGLALVTIQVRTAINQVSNEISETSAVITAKQEKVIKLEQEKAELSKADRIKAIAGKKGLTENDGNRRTVK